MNGKKVCVCVWLWFDKFYSIVLLLHFYMSCENLCLLMFSVLSILLRQMHACVCKCVLYVCVLHFWYVSCYIVIGFEKIATPSEIHAMDVNCYQHLQNDYLKRKIGSKSRLFLQETKKNAFERWTKSTYAVWKEHKKLRVSPMVAI